VAASAIALAIAKAAPRRIVEVPAHGELGLSTPESLSPLVGEGKISVDG
jgi:hypothetical protein